MLQTESFFKEQQWHLWEKEKKKVLSNKKLIYKSL